MKRYIDCESACIEVDKGDLLVGDNAKWAKEIIYRTPAVDVVEVIHAQWVIPDKYYPLTCTHCKFEYCGWENDDGYIPNYCLNCGAQMDKKVYYLYL